jgi:uncharacterized protein
MSDSSLRGRHALVTGASSGLGADFARELASRGADLTLVARRQELLEAVRDEVGARHGVEVALVPLDLTEPGAPETLHASADGGGHPVDVLVNNAGYALYGPFAEIPWEREANMLQLDVVVPVHLTKLFLPGIRAGRAWSPAASTRCRPGATGSSPAGCRRRSPTA